MLQPLANKEQAAQLLATYWKERGMPEYDKQWALTFLEKGHRTEVKTDEFFEFQEGDEIIGMISLITDVSGVAEIRDLVVKQAYREKGYGKRILAEMANLAKEKKLRKVYALVFPKLKGMYESLGFEEEGHLKSHFTEGEDLLFMSRLL